MALNLRITRNDGVLCGVVFQDQGDSGPKGFWRTSFVINGEEHFSDVKKSSAEKAEISAMRREVEDVAFLHSLGFDCYEVHRAIDEALALRADAHPL